MACQGKYYSKHSLVSFFYCVFFLKFYFSYVEYRRFCNLSVPYSWDEMAAIVPDAGVRSKLKGLYGHPGILPRSSIIVPFLSQYRPLGRWSCGGTSSRRFNGTHFRLHYCGPVQKITRWRSFLVGYTNTFVHFQYLGMKTKESSTKCSCNKSRNPPLPGYSAITVTTSTGSR